ncbi:MAG: hypothetical protein R2789_16280 [Microthrixaceae bacterium]
MSSHFEQRGAEVRWVAERTNETSGAATNEGDASIWRVVAIEAIGPNEAIVKVETEGLMPKEKAASETMCGC